MLRYLLVFLLSLFFIDSAQARAKKPLAYSPSTPATTFAAQFPPARPAEAIPRPALGFEGGMGLAQTAFSEGGADVSDTSARQTFGGGLFFDLPLSRYFSLSPEILYLSKGVHAEGQGREFRFDFLELPVLAKLHFTTGEFRPFVFAGPSVGIPLTRTSIASDGTTTDVDGGGMVDVSAQVGLGAEIDVGGNVGLVFSGRYIHGFNDQTMDANQTLYNRTLLFMAGFRVGL